MDASLVLKAIEDPRKNSVWASMAGSALLDGKGWQLSVEQQEMLLFVFGITDMVCKEPQYVEDVWKKICSGLERYKGYCWRRMVCGT
jgi:hypothetical protein